MRTLEVIPEKWSEFLDKFSRRHQSWKATMDVFSEEIGSQREFKSRPFRGIALDRKGGRIEVEVMAGENNRNHITHTIPNPRSIWLEQGSAEGDEVLEIESTDAKTIIRLEHVLPAEFLDESVE